MAVALEGLGLTAVDAADWAGELGRAAHRFDVVLLDAAHATAADAVRRLAPEAAVLLCGDVADDAPPPHRALPVPASLLRALASGIGVCGAKGRKVSRLIDKFACSSTYPEPEWSATLAWPVVTAE